MPEAVKFVEGSETRLRILAIPFGGLPELGNRDLDDEFFTAKTDLCHSWYPVQRPLLYEHGKHADVDVAPVGRVDSTTVDLEDEVGVWVEAELDKQARYYEHIRRMVEQKKLYASSGAMGHLVKRADNGHLDRWPWVELSLTPTPANPLARVEAKTAVKHYKAAGITPPPIMDDDAARPYIDLLDRLTDDSVEFIDLTRRLAEGRTKVGRALSRRRRDQLLALAGQWETGASDLRQIVAEAEVAPKPEARADGEAIDQETPEPTPDGAEGEGKTAETTEQGGLTAHVDPDLAAIYAEFQRADAFYGAALSPGRLRGARIVRT